MNFSVIEVWKNQRKSKLEQLLLLVYKVVHKTM
jgi:hypothetical protein